MKERPILFSGSMVRALLDGRKTQTRRVVKRAALEAIQFCTDRADGTPAGSSDLGYFYDRPEVEDSIGRVRALKHPEWLFYNAEYPEEGSVPVGHGYGAVGDRLWVKETTAIVSVDGNMVGVARRERIPAGKSLAQTDGGLELIHLEGAQLAQAIRLKDDERWRPSIHMPRWASRITLEVTGVRVERLQEISDADCEAEGIKQRWTCISPGLGSYAHDNDVRDDYQKLWTSINGAESWNANPWVWVVEFKRVKP